MYGILDAYHNEVCIRSTDYETVRAEYDELRNVQKRDVWLVYWRTENNYTVIAH